MVIGVGTLQTLLDRGNQEGWWQSGFIDLLALTTVLGLVLFVVRTLRVPCPVVDLRLFPDRDLERTLGSTMGVSIAATAYTRFGQIGWNQLGGHINPFNPALYRWLDVQNLDMSHAGKAVARAAEKQSLSRHSHFVSFG